jgi:hypothetical protein
MQLTLIGSSITPDGSAPSLYSVDGLAAEQGCIIGYAGKGSDGKNKWYAHIYKTGELVGNLGPANSPEDALQLVEEKLM